MRAGDAGNNAGEGVCCKQLAVDGLCPHAAWGTGILGLGKPCERPKSAAGGRSVVLRFDLVGGLAGGTFYIRARLRAGACVPVDNETLGPWDPLRVVEPLAVWTLSLCSPDSTGCGLLTSEKASPSAEGRARHARPRGPEESRNSQVRRVETAGNRRNSDSPRQGSETGRAGGEHASLTVGTRREDGDSVAHDPAAGP